jgi:hypothetical protein
MAEAARELLASVWSALGGDRPGWERVDFEGEGGYTSAFRVTDLAAAAIGAAALAIAEFMALHSARAPLVRIDRRLASFWFAGSIRPDGWKLPPVWDPVAGDYATADGWIRLHTNAPHHRAAAERVLGAHGDRDAMGRAVAAWPKDDLESAIVAAGGCAAAMHTLDEWAQHPQGIAVAQEALVAMGRTSAGSRDEQTIEPSRPLAGVRVLDLTRVLAGPVATRFLAGFGAQVLRLDPPGWNEPAVVPEVTLGKRCARLDLRTRVGCAQFETLLRGADVLVHGYRSDALARLGFDAERRAHLRPGLIDVSLDAYGWTGLWQTRRGFDSLVQMSTGIADAGMRWRGADRPVPLPVQALDHATGYLLAAAVVRGLVTRRERGEGLRVSCSLARTARLLVDAGLAPPAPRMVPEGAGDCGTDEERTPWGPAHRLHPPLAIDGAPMRWTSPACELGSSAAAWDKQ